MNKQRSKPSPKKGGKPSTDKPKAPKKETDLKRKRDDSHENPSESGAPPKKMSKREKKDAVNQKKQKRNSNWDMITNTKLKWEEFNNMNNSLKKKKNKEADAKRQKPLTELFNLLQGKLYEVAIRHDTSRIIQSILKWGTESQIFKIFEELKPKLKELSENMYGHKLVMKMLKYLPKRLKEKSLKVKDELFTILFKRQLRNMLTKRFPAQLVDYAYMTVWSNKERNIYLREFYGSEYWFSNDDSDEVVSLKEVLEKNPGKTTAVVGSLEQVISKIISKGLIDLELSQKLLVDFFEVADRVSIQNAIFDLAENDAIPYILHTHDGATISIYCVAYGTIKDRRRIIQSLSNTEGESLIVKACKTYCGSIVIRYLLQTVDDTVRTNKSLLKDVKKHLLDLMTDTHASKVILHLLSAENKSYFQKEEIDMVHPTLRESVLKSKAQKQEKKEGEEKEEKEDEEMENTEQEGTEQSQDPLQPTKKSPEKIRKELLQHMSLALIETISNNMKTVIAHNVANKVVLETFLNPEIPNEALYTQLIELLVENKEQAGLLLSQQASSRMLSRLIMSEESHTFATQLLEALSGDKLKKFVLESHGAYLVAALCKVKDIKARLKPFMDQVRKGTEPGLKFLTGTVEGFKE